MKTHLPLIVVLLVAFLFFPALTLAQSEKKAVYGVLVDNTGTMKTQFDVVQALGKSIVSNTSQRGIVSLFNFETQVGNKNPFAVVASGTKWSQNKDALAKHIDGISVVTGQTILFDGILSIAKIIDAKAKSDSLPDKIIVMITDGEDRASAVTEKQLLKELKDSGVKVYVVGLIQELSGENEHTRANSPQLVSKNFLKKIAKETGGNVIFPKLKKNIKVEDLITELFAESSKK